MRQIKFFLSLVLMISLTTATYSKDVDTEYHPYPKISKKSGVKLPIRSVKPIVISTLDEMQDYMKKDNVHVILEAGEYWITAQEVSAGKYPSITEVVENRPSNALFLVTANGSTYDFGGAVIQIESKEIFNLPYLKGELVDLHILGNNNVITGVTFVDNAGIHDFPPKGCTNVMIDGRENIVDNLTLRSVGSMPYGYGDIFGKGGGALIKLKKHCGVLVRGDDNTFQNSTVYHNAYGHCVFMQGAVRPNIINNHISSKMITTEAILAEKGDPNSKANQIDFMTTWGYQMTKNLNYTKAVCEAGIRAYNSGNTMIDGVRYRRKAVDGPYIAGNYVKDTRVGVTLTHSNNVTRRTLVEDCITLGTERGYAVNDYAIVRNCASDAKYGPAFGVDYPSGKGNIIDIKIVDEKSSDYIVSPYDGKSYRTGNGEAHVAYIQGSGHRIKFREGRIKDIYKQIHTTCADRKISFSAFDLGGHIRIISNIWKPTKDGQNAPETLNNDNKSRLVDSYIANETSIPIRVDANSEGNHIWSVGQVYEEKKGTNEVVQGEDWKINKVFDLE
ncbi:MAG: hypothetical protein SNG02_05315 [Rikenellaceae bacterium]